MGKELYIIEDFISAQEKSNYDTYDTSDIEYIIQKLYGENVKCDTRPKLQTFFAKHEIYLKSIKKDELEQIAQEFRGLLKIHKSFETMPDVVTS